MGALTVPERIQMRRTKGWRKPEATIYVGRPTRWGNPYAVGERDVIVFQGETLGPGPGFYNPRDIRLCDQLLDVPLSADLAVALYRSGLIGNIENGDPYYDEFRAALRRLRGHDLACWCRLDAPCHADVLLEVANA